MESETNKQNQWIPRFLATTVILAGALMIPSTSSLAQHIVRPEESNSRLDQRLPSPLEDRAVSARLTVAAQAFGVETQPEHTAYASGNGISVVAAPLAGIEDIPASALPDGVPSMFAYVEAPDHPELPDTGYYLVNVTASEEVVEDTFERTQDPEGSPPREGNARMEFINPRGETVAEFDDRATLQHVLSVDEVPETADRSRNFVDVSKEGSADAPGESRVRIWVECSNGWRACLDIRW